MRCKQKLEDSKDNRLVRYCALEIGHLGLCVPLLSMTHPQRCTAISPQGIQCGTPKHPTGRHMNGLLCVPWDGDHAKK